MAASPQQTRSPEESSTFSPTIIAPDGLSGVEWKPLDASQAAASLKSSRRQDEFSPAHRIIASIRAEAMLPLGISGVEMRWWRSWVLVECPCGTLRAIQKMDVRKAIRRGQNLYCSTTCATAGIATSLRKNHCPTCGGPVPRSRKRTCSDACLQELREQSSPSRTCEQCGNEFRPKSSRTTYCSRDCANAAHSRRMIGRGNSHYKQGKSYAKWFRTMRPLILERDGNRCSVCAASPVLTFLRSGKTVTRSALVIHHINEDVRDNRPQNLITLCVPCHAVHHKSSTTPWPWFVQRGW